MPESDDVPQLTFAEQSLDALRESLRMADEYLIQAHAAERGAVMVERVAVTNQNVQSIGIVLTRTASGLLEIAVTHRGQEGSEVIAPNDTQEFDV